MPEQVSGRGYDDGMRVAITGVSGFIGSVLAHRFAADGWRVTGLVRRTSRREHVAAVVDRLVEGDQADSSAWPDLLDDADVVVHNSTDWALRTDPDGYARSNLLGSLGLLHASAPRPFVFVSTIAVHHDMRPRWGGVVDEDHPARPGNAYGAYKAGVEAFLWAERHERARACAAVRPCAVYGIDPKLERSIGHPILAGIARADAFTRPGGGKFVHVDDVASAVLACAASPEHAPPVLNLVDCYARWADWAQLASEILGVEAAIDFSSPSAPRNTFDCAAARALVPDDPAFLARGHQGIRGHLTELASRMDLPAPRA